MAPYGPFKTSVDAWERMLSSGQLGRVMLSGLDRLGRQKGLEMYADWGERIAKGEVPPAPPRPQGIERNIVVTVWDWARAGVLPSCSHQHRQAKSNGECLRAGVWRRMVAQAGLPWWIPSKIRKS